MGFQTGQVINSRYRIVRLLGQGGFGAVYRAWDMNLNQACALKENLDTSPEAQRQFAREATVLARLAHPNLPRVTDHFSVSGQGQYLVMDYVEGEDLEAMVKRQGPVTTEQALSWISQVADALIYLHNQNPPVLHRDIKPANIRITPDGRALLVDFGLVKFYDPNLRTTMGARAVTPGYSPPEQYGKGATDVRTDIYALGATLYDLLTGQEPLESVQRMAGDQFMPAHQLNAAIPPTISDTVERAMSLTPSQRYQSMEEFKKHLAGSESGAQPVPPLVRAAAATVMAGAAAGATPSQPPPVVAGTSRPASTPVFAPVGGSVSVPPAVPAMGQPATKKRGRGWIFAVVLLFVAALAAGFWIFDPLGVFGGGRDETATPEIITTSASNASGQGTTATMVLTQPGPTRTSFSKPSPTATRTATSLAPTRTSTPTRTAIPTATRTSGGAPAQPTSTVRPTQPPTSPTNTPRPVQPTQPPPPPPTEPPPPPPTEPPPPEPTAPPP